MNTSAPLCLINPCQTQERYAYDVRATPQDMRSRVVVKWGGGLITEKGILKTVRTDILNSLAEQLERCLKANLDIILVHGAGSFGHLKAKQYRLAEGRVSDENMEGEMTQDEAIQSVRSDMMELNQHVLDALTQRDISAVSLPPHNWARNTGPNFQGDISIFGQSPAGIVMITHGDVVECDGPLEFGILSGDDIVLRFSQELPGVERLVFAMGGVDGVLASPPNEQGEGKLLPILKKEDVFTGEHHSEMDVTGGIGLKVARGFEALDAGVEVYLVSGERGERVAEACLGLDVFGTRLAS
jgi:isopentenyl phosphate kinase